MVSVFVFGVFGHYERFPTKIKHWKPPKSEIILRELPFMRSAKFWDFFTPDFVPFVCFLGAPPPLTADVIYGSPLSQITEVFWEMWWHAREMSSYRSILPAKLLPTVFRNMCATAKMIAWQKGVSSTAGFRPPRISSLSQPKSEFSIIILITIVSARLGQWPQKITKQSTFVGCWFIPRN